MTKKILVILAIALIALCCVASAAPYRDYDMKYNDPVANDRATDPSYSSGQLYIDVLCMHNLFSKDVVIQRVIVDNKSPSFVNGNSVKKEFLARFVSDGANTTIQLAADGKYDTRLSPGTYALTLSDGNNGDPEYALVTICAGSSSRVHFVGHGVTPADAAQEKSLSIINASYGMIVTVPGTNPVYHTIHHPAVPAILAWTEHFGDYAKHGNHYDYVGYKNGDYTQSWQYGHYGYTYVAPVHHPATPAIPAWDEQVLVTPGTPATTTGSYIDVTGIVRGLVANGELHIIADYPNLHYNALFTDPCPGQVKTLTVNYQLNGVTGTKTVSETEDLNIG